MRSSDLRVYLLYILLSVTFCTVSFSKGMNLLAAEPRDIKLDLNLLFCSELRGISSNDPTPSPLPLKGRGRGRGHVTLNGQGSGIHTIPLGNKRTASDQDTAIRVAFISLQPANASSDELKAAFEFLQGEKKLSCTWITFSDILKHPKKLGDYRLIWFHRPDSVAFHDEEVNPKVLEVIKSYISQGGKLLLTLSALKYIIPLGIETEPPTDSLKTSVDDGYGRKLGFHSFLDHPLFDGLYGGAYIWRPVKDLNTRIYGYFGEKVPKNGKVVAVDWDYIFLRENSKLILEYAPEKGEVIAIGAYTWFSQPNFNRQHLRIFTRNTINYLINSKSGEKAKYWNYEPASVTKSPLKTRETDQFLVAVPESVKWQEEEDPLVLNNRYCGTNYTEIAGQRILTMGQEKGGIEEVWTHPFMAFRDFEAGIRFGDQGKVYWLNEKRPQIEVHPAYIKRIYRFPRAYLTEITVNDPLEPSGVVHYEYQGVYDAELIVRFKSNLRLMWPYSEKMTGSINYGWDPDLNAFAVWNKSGEMAMMAGANENPTETYSGQYSSISYDPSNKKLTGIPDKELSVSCAAMYPLSMTHRLDLVFCGTNEGLDITRSYFEKVLRDPLRIYVRADSTCRSFLTHSLSISTPDENFNKGYLWSLIASYRFLVYTPEMGTSLVAGYATTKHGWDGGHKINGRPGYGWYFGRDGEWSGMALLDYGDFEHVRSILDFYQKYQDLSGKIFHEATTSGVIHYDAADATPLYIVLAGRYFRHTNDTDFLRNNWTYIKKAVDFCFSTDTDGDHLIENTNVGHGWVEGGELYGSHATLYLNACWTEALNLTSEMARLMKQPEAESYLLEMKTVRNVIGSEFWNQGVKFFSYGKNKNGSFRVEPTVLPAVPLLFKLTNKERASEVLSQFASNAFTTNWGVRIIRDDSPLFNPRGYHYGSVWPLFTGWTSLAEFNYGNYQQGFSHLMNNLNVYKNWGLGYVEEVLNGGVYSPSGVCSHQCWSETMVSQPAIEGLLGLSVDAPKNKIVLSPHFPANWDSVAVEKIRVGSKTFSFAFHRNADKYYVSLKPDQPGMIRIEFIPTFPAGTQFSDILMDGKKTLFTSFPTLQYNALLFQFDLSGPVTIEIGYDKGISILPVVQNPKTGDHSGGLRLVSSIFNGNKYNLLLEGVTGTSENFDIYIHRQETGMVTGAKLTQKDGDIYHFRVEFASGQSKYATKEISIQLK